MKYLVGLICTISWISGIVLASAGWGKVIATIVPPYAYYLLIEHIMILTHFI